jgi:hypothetical protein
MLAELEALDLILRQVEEFGHSSPFLEIFPRMDVIERTADYVDVLSTDAVRSLITLNVVLGSERVNMRKVDQGFALLDKSQWTEAQQLEALDKHAHAIQDKAAALLTRTAEARRLLIADGGKHVQARAIQARVTGAGNVTVKAIRSPEPEHRG